MHLQQPAISTSNLQPATKNQQRVTSIKFLFWLYALFVIYGVTMPLHPDLTRSGLKHRWKHAERIPFLNSEGGRLSFGDAVGNILLFMPFGFFLQSWRQSRRAATIGRSQYQIGMFFSLLVTLLFSGTIECGQLFLDSRTTSVNDVMTNLLGAFIGARLAVAHPGLVVRTFEALKRMARLRPLLALWLATMVLQTLIALAPYDFTLKKENFQRQWLRWQYSWQELRNAWQVSSGENNFLQRFPHYAHLLLALIITIGCGILLGMLLVLGCHRYGVSSPRLVWGLTLVTLGFYPTVTILQFTVQSVHPFVIFPAMGIGGVMAGVLLIIIFLQFIAHLGTSKNFS